MGSAPSGGAWQTTGRCSNEQEFQRRHPRSREAWASSSTGKMTFFVGLKLSHPPPGRIKFQQVCSTQEPVKRGSGGDSQNPLAPSSPICDSILQIERRARTGVHRDIPPHTPPVSEGLMNEVLSLILGGGRGTRLYPLTKLRSKPAVPVAGKYRLIDIPISNCINSGMSRVYVLTQFLSVSLHRHIANTYKFDPFSQSFVEVLAAQQTNETSDWYQGTADAVRQQVRYVIEDPCEDVLILSGDQLYRMDFRHLLKTHRESKADATLAMIAVTQTQVSELGLARVDDGGRII